jgi:uncharacterized membrane protein HdeD (DUF308 family)
MVAVFIIMVILGGIVLICGLLALADAFDGPEVFGSIVAMVIGLGLLIAGTAGGINKANEYDQETVRICSAKHGVVSKDNHCFVDGKPVEFIPGVWER